MYKEERGALEEMRNVDVCDSEELGRLERSEKTIAILEDRWWPQVAKQDGDGVSKQFLCNMWKKRNERRNVGGVSVRSRNGAPSRKRCVVNGQMKASNNRVRPPRCSVSKGMRGQWSYDEGKQQMNTPPPATSPSRRRRRCLSVATPPSPPPQNTCLKT